MEKISFVTVNDYSACPSIAIDFAAKKKIQIASIGAIVAMLCALLPIARPATPLPSDRLQQIMAKNQHDMRSAIYQFSALTRSWCSGVKAIKYASLSLPSAQQWARITAPTFDAGQHACHDRDKTMLL